MDSNMLTHALTTGCSLHFLLIVFLAQRGRKFVCRHYFSCNGRKNSQSPERSAEEVTDTDSMFPTVDGSGKMEYSSEEGDE